MARKDPFIKARILEATYTAKNMSLKMTPKQARRWRKRVNKAIGW